MLSGFKNSVVEAFFWRASMLRARVLGTGGEAKMQFMHIPGGG